MKFNKEKIKKYYPHMLIMIGILPIIFHAIEVFNQYTILNTIGKFATVLDKVFFQNTFNSLLTNYVTTTFGVLITAIIGILVSLVLAVYLVKVIKNPKKNDFIVIAVLGIIGILLNSVIGGILIIVGGIVGYRRHSQIK